MDLKHCEKGVHTPREAVSLEFQFLGNRPEYPFRVWDEDGTHYLDPNLFALGCTIPRQVMAKSMLKTPWDVPETFEPLRTREEMTPLFALARAEYPDHLWYVDKLALAPDHAVAVLYLGGTQGSAFYDGHHLSQPCIPGHLLIEMGAQVALSLSAMQVTRPVEAKTARPFAADLHEIDLRAPVTNLREVLCFTRVVSRRGVSTTCEVCILRSTATGFAPAFTMQVRGIIVDEHGKYIKLK